MFRCASPHYYSDRGHSSTRPKCQRARAQRGEQDMSAPTPTAAAADTATFAIEVHGINPIPEAERWAKPKHVFGLIFGGANSISTAVLGAFGPVFGLTFWDGALAIVLGVVIGSLILF